MSSEETLIQVRVEKHQQLNGGVYPVPAERDNSLRWKINSYLEHFDLLQKSNKLLTTINPADVRVDHKFLVRGRITALRKSGSITFIKVMDSTGSIQILISKSSYSNYEHLKLLDFGDIVEVLGVPILSKTGEKSVLAEEIVLLTKAHRPPPEKFSGIADTELKYRKRYLDLMSSEESRARFLVRSAVMQSIRRFMEFENFHEVETSTLNTVASGANAKPFITHHNALDTDLRLRIAPELYLKRLLVGGLDKVYEIGRAYRNEGIDTRHNPEFTIMESYEAYGNFTRLVQFTQDLLRTIDTFVSARLSGPTLEYYNRWKAERPFTLAEFRQVPMFDAVVAGMRKASMDWHSSGSFGQVDILDTTNPRLQEIDLKAMMHGLEEASSNGEKIAVLFEHVAEPFLTEDYRSEDKSKSIPVFITKYPKSVCPLARSNDEHPEECDRFELFIEGRELCNAFQELNDPDEQAVRFHEQLESNQKDPMDFDADYVEALEYGMPPAIGFGMGIDRLVMLLTNTTSIKDVILFPTLKPVR